MMEANVDALSFYQDNEKVFFSGIVSVEMRGNLAYITRVLVGATSGNIINSECDLFSLDWVVRSGLNFK